MWFYFYWSQVGGSGKGRRFEILRVRGTGVVVPPRLLPPRPENLLSVVVSGVLATWGSLRAFSVNWRSRGKGEDFTPVVGTGYPTAVLSVLPSGGDVRLVHMSWMAHRTPWGKGEP